MDKNNRHIYNELQPPSTMSGSSTSNRDYSNGSLPVPGDRSTNEHYASFGHLPSYACSPIYESDAFATRAEMTERLGTTGSSVHQSPPYLSTSRLSHYSRDSNQSSSPPVSPLTTLPSQEISEIPDYRNRGAYIVDNRIYTTFQSSSPPVSPLTTSQEIPEIPDCRNRGSYVDNRNPHDANKYEDESYRSYTTFPLTSYQSTMGSSSDLSSRSGKAVYDVMLNESGVSDSGLFDTSNEVHKTAVTRQDSGHSSGAYCSDENNETAQIRIGLEYRWMDEKLILTVERGRHINTLCVQPLKYIYVKGSLLPTSAEQRFSIRTHKSVDTDRPAFNEQFLLTIDRSNLLNKTLQVDVVGLTTETNREESLGGSQISLAEFESDRDIGHKWYNLLGSFITTSHALNRSNSAVSVEAIQGKLNTLPSLLANSEEGFHNDDNRRSYSLNSDKRSRGRLNSEDRCSITSSSSLNLDTNPLRASTERKYTPPRLTSHVLEHLQSRSREREERTARVNVGRSVSDCSGYRRSSVDAPFVRMGVGRRSVRQKNRLEELKSQKSVPTVSPVQPKREPRPVARRKSDKYAVRKSASMTPLDLDFKLQAALSKQESLCEEIFHLKEIKLLMEARRREGSNDLPQWLAENGDYFDTLLRETKEQVSSHLLENESFAQLNKTYSKSVKGNMVGYEDNGVLKTDTRTVIQKNPEIHWV